MMDIMRGSPEDVQPTMTTGRHHQSANGPDEKDTVVDGEQKGQQRNPTEVPEEVLEWVTKSDHVGPWYPGGLMVETVNVLIEPRTMEESVSQIEPNLQK